MVGFTNYLRNVEMKRSFPQFIISLLVGLCFGLIALALAGYLNIWKQDWRAEHSIELQELIPVATQTSQYPNLPNVILPLSIYNLVSQQDFDSSIVREKRPVIDVSVIDKDPLPIRVLGVKKSEEFTNFEKKLQNRRASSVSCPKGKSLFWDGCFGTFKAPWGVTYSGIWREDKLNGLAKSVDLKTGDTYIGEFANNMFDGCGIFISTSGSIKSGQWIKNSFISDSSPCDPQQFD